MSRRREAGGSDPRRAASDRRRKAVVPRYDPETGNLAVPTTTTFHPPERMVDLPAKLPGHHRWVLTSGYTMTDSEAAAAHEGVVSVLMGPDRMVSFGVTCWDCEMPYPVVAARRCRGDAAWESDRVILPRSES